MTWQALMKEELERLRQADIPEADSDIRLLAMDVALQKAIMEINIVIAGESQMKVSYQKAEVVAVLL